MTTSRPEAGELAGLREAVEALPVLRLSGENLDMVPAADVFAVDWDEYDEFVRLDDVLAALTAATSRPEVEAIERCGDHPLFGPSARDTLGLGCGTFLTGEAESKLAYRCAQCQTAFCETCIKQHFGWPEAGGGPMPHDLDKAIAALAAAKPSPTGSHWANEMSRNVHEGRKATTDKPSPEPARDEWLGPEYAAALGEHLGDAVPGDALRTALAKLPPGPYRVEWPSEPGGALLLWGQSGTPPDYMDGWAIPIVASGVDICMFALADILNTLGGYS